MRREVVKNRTGELGQGLVGWVVELVVWLCVG
jgi:hypothetical protein